MKILVNSLPIRFGGGVTYVQRQLSALAKVAPDLELHTLVAPWTEGTDRLPGEVEVVRAASVPARFGYEQAVLPFRRADLVYCPANFAPFYHPDPLVLTAQNPNYYRDGLDLPEAAPSRPWWKVKANHVAMRTADAVVAISEASAADIRRTLPGIKRLEVIPSGAPEWPGPAEPLPGLPERYVVTTGSHAPHKFVDDSVAAWSRSVDLDPTAPALVIIGPLKDELQARCRAAAGAHVERLVLAGQVNRREQVRWVMAHALALVSTTRLESFHLVPQEAGSVGCPVVITDLAVHREVTEGRAVFFAPGDIEGLARILVDQVYPERLDRTPWEWGVSWEDNASQLAEVFRSLRRTKR